MTDLAVFFLVVSTSSPPHPNGWVCQEPKLRTGIGYLKLGKVFPLKKNSGCETLRILEVNHWPPILGCHKFTQNIHVRLIRVNLVDLLCLFCFTWICFTSFISNIIISTWCFVSSSFLTHATLGVQRWLVCFSSCLFLVCSRGTHQRDQWLHPGLNVKKWMFVENICHYACFFLDTRNLEYTSWTWMFSHVYAHLNFNRYWMQTSELIANLLCHGNLN